MPEQIDQAYEDLQIAIEKFVAARGERTPMLTDWILVASCVGPDDPRRTGYLYPMSVSPPHHLNGLLSRVQSYMIEIDAQNENECTCGDHDDEED